MSPPSAKELIDDARLKRLEASWKSDVDLKLDRMVTFANKYEAYLEILIERDLAKKKLRNAVIEKTLLGLIWSGLSFVALAAWHYIKDVVKR